MKRKTSVCALLMILVAVAVMSACGKNSGSSDSGGSTAPSMGGTTAADSSNSDKPLAGTVLHTIASPSNEEFFTKINQEFKEKTGIEIQVDTVGYNDVAPKLMNSFMAGGSTYDLFVMDVIDLPRFVSAGWVAPVDEWITDDMKKDLLPFAAQALQYEGKFYGLPYASEYKSFVYNKAMLEKAGFTAPPKTWDDFIQYSKTLQEKGIVKYASAWAWSQTEGLVCDFVAIASSMGGKLFDDSGNPVLNSPENVQALQLMVDMIYKHKIVDPASLQYNESNVLSAMSAGDIAFELNWGLPLTPLNDKSKSKIVGQAEVAPLPYTVSSATIAGPMSYAISAGSKNKEAAWEYIKFLNDQNGSKRQALEIGMFPGWKSVYEDAEVKSGVPGLDKILEQAEVAVNRPQIPWYNEWSSKFQVELQNALTQKKTPQQALDDAMEESQKIKESNS